jgi:membrane protein DedA with SNARE-associated domain
MHILASGSAPSLPGFLNSLAGPLDHFGYWAVLLLVLLEDFGVPVPGETVLIAASVYAGAGRLNAVAVGAVGFVAAVIGDNIGFAIGHFGGRALVLRWGRYVRLTEARLHKAEASFYRHSAWIITVARFIEVLRQVNGIVAGTTGVRWLRFLAFNALGAALWVGTWVSLGYLAGSHIDTIYHRITTYSFYVLTALAVLLVAYIARRALRRRSRAAPTREQAGRESGTVTGPGARGESPGSDEDRSPARSADCNGDPGVKTPTQDPGKACQQGNGA